MTVETSSRAALSWPVKGSSLYEIAENVNTFGSTGCDEEKSKNGAFVVSDPSDSGDEAREQAGICSDCKAVPSACENFQAPPN
jgi:hypothetical protein